MSPQAQSDVSLLQACMQGNNYAFEGIVDRYQSLVCAITYSGTGSIHISEELAQTTFLLAWKNLGQLRDLDKFQAWLCRIARSTVQSWRRKRQRDLAAQAAPLEAAAGQSAQAYEPVEAAIHKEQEVVLKQALGHIPVKYREPLILFYREKKSTREVARLLGLSENAARQRLSRARSMLKRQVTALIETTLAQTRPGKAFTAGVMASLAGLTIKGTTAATAQVAVNSGSLGLTGVLSGIAVKVALVAAGVVIVAGGVLLYKQREPERESSPEVLAGQQATLESAPSATTEDPNPAQGLPGTTAPAATLIGPDSQQVAPAAASSSPRAQGSFGQVTGPHEFKAQGVLSGLVTDSETGAPIKGALVSIVNNGGSARTDEHGFYSIEKLFRPGNCRINVYSQTYVGIDYAGNETLVNLSQGRQQVKHLRLPRACMVKVRVTDANGLGIEDARVVVTSPADAHKREISGQVMPEHTDRNGEIRLGGIPPSQTDYLITVWHKAVTQEQKSDQASAWMSAQYDYAAAKAEVRLTDPNIIDTVEIVLEKGEPVYGYAEYSDGVPASDIQINAQPAWWHCYGGADRYATQANGTFTLKHITPGSYDIQTLTPGPEGLPPACKTIVQVQLPPPDGEPLILHLPVASPQSLASISGRVVFVKEATDDIEVRAYSPTLGTKHLYVHLAKGINPQQRFHLAGLKPGDYRLEFSGREIESRILENVTAPCENLEVELQFTGEGRPTLSGSVIDAQTGKPVQAFRARLRKKRTLRGPYYLPSDQWAVFSGTEGRFELESVGPGIYQVQVMAQAYAPRLSEEINTDQLSDLVLTLTAGGRIKGTVIDQAGEPVDGAKVIPLSHAGGTTVQTRDVFVSEDGACETEKGLFTLTSLPAGMESLQVTHPDYAFRIVQGIEVLEDQVTTDVEIVLTPGGTIEGMVFDEHGQALADQVLYFQDDDDYSGTSEDLIGRLATAVTDSNGCYRVAHLPEQVCYVNRGVPGKTLGVVRRTVMPLEGKTLRLDFGGEPIVSGAILLQGSPLAQGRVQLRSLGSFKSAHFKCFAKTDEQGNFAFRGAVPGAYTIHYEAPNSKERWEQLTTLDLAHTNLDLGVIGSAHTELLVHIQQSPTVPPVPIKRVALSESRIDSCYVPGKYTAKTPPSRPEDPWVLPDAKAGVYTLTLTREDRVQFRQEITLPPGQEQWEISWAHPAQTASLSGSLGEAQELVTLCQDSMQSVVTLIADEEGRYSVKDLPAGTFGFNTDLRMLYHLAPLAQITLSAGEDREFNPDLTVPQEEQSNSLVVQVLDDRGTLRSDVSLSLAGALGEVAPVNSFRGKYYFIASCGRHILHVAADGYQPMEKAVTLAPFEPGVKPQNLQIRLEPQ